jgi:hypothetical protein
VDLAACLFQSESPHQNSSCIFFKSIAWKSGSGICVRQPSLYCHFFVQFEWPSLYFSLPLVQMPAPPRIAW